MGRADPADPKVESSAPAHTSKTDFLLFLISGKKYCRRVNDTLEVTLKFNH